MPLEDELAGINEDFKYFLTWFLNRDEHKWLKTQYSLFDALIDVFERLSSVERKKLIMKHNLRVVPCGFNTSKFHRGAVIELSADMLDDENGLLAVILCREIGKMVISESKRYLSNVELEIAADRFAVSKGFSQNVEDLILNEDEGMEKRLRLVYLTTLVMRDEYV